MRSPNIAHEKSNIDFQNQNIGIISHLKNNLALTLAALGIVGYTTGEVITSTFSGKNTTDNVRYVPTQDPISSGETTEVFFGNIHTKSFENFPEGVANLHKDSLNHIIEAKIAEIQKQRENEFLQTKFIAFQKNIITSLNELIDVQLFPKEKQDNLSDEQLKTLEDNVSSATDLTSLSNACQQIISYIDELLSKKNINIHGKTLKTKNIKDSEFFITLDRYKNTFKEFITTINNTHFEPEVFKNVQPNTEVLGHSSTIDSIKKSISTKQDSLNSIQNLLVTLYKDLNDSTDMKIEVELALSSGKIDYTEFENTTIIADTNALNQKHTMEQIENERKNHIVKLESFILAQSKKIIDIEEHQTPAISNDINNLYKQYGITLKALIDAIRTQHTNIMTEKDKSISDQIHAFKLLITDIYGKIDSLKTQHQSILDAITTEKGKIHLSDSSKIESLLAKYQTEENIIAQTYTKTNDELINKNIELGNMLVENYDTYLDMLKKCKEPLSGYFTSIEEEITSLETSIADFQKKYNENESKIKEFSSSDTIDDVNSCQKLIKENQIYNKKIIEIKKERDEKISTKKDIEGEIHEIDNVFQYITNNKDLTMFGMKIYLAAKQIQAAQAQLESAEHVKKNYGLLLQDKNTEFSKIGHTLSLVNIDIQKTNTNLDTNTYASLSTLMKQKDSLLLSKKALELDIQNVQGKIEAKNREINNLKKRISDLAAFGSDELKKREGLIYNRDQSFSKEARKSKYYKQELIRSPEEILEDVGTIITTIKSVK